MTARRKPTKGSERRTWTKNLPAGPHGWERRILGVRIGADRPDWTPAQRADQLQSRDRRIGWGKLLTVIGTVVVATLNLSVEYIKIDTKLAVLEARLLGQQQDIQRLQSYWGSPPPRFGQP